MVPRTAAMRSSMRRDPMPAAWSSRKIRAKLCRSSIVIRSHAEQRDSCGRGTLVVTNDAANLSPCLLFAGLTRIQGKEPS